ncbi:4Fe-4S dicluster domain-containing protein, partial [Candidatus Bathyarchaeota archaeon]|nr:4Fe-4S dicluster domain-containing protein [Candidatus Bathyarchaeota archaeon]
TVTETLTKEATKTLTSTATATVPTTLTSTTTRELTKTVSTTATVTAKLLKSAYISLDIEKCVGCMRCVLACALVHEGAIAPQLSRIKWREEFVKGYLREPLFCLQCDDPECYWACPLRDEALCIDEKTGARYINGEKCIGCKECIKACPLNPPRINFDPERNIAIKCDLCKDRPEGPACIEVCSEAGGGKALSLVYRR